MATTTRTAGVLPVVPGIDPFAITVTPMSVRTDYQLSTKGHRMTGTLRHKEVIDTGWHPTAAKAAAAYGRALAKLAAVQAARYTVNG